MLRIVRALAPAAAVVAALVAPSSGRAQDLELSFLDTVLNGEGPIEYMARVVDTVVSPDGLHAYVTGRRDDSIVIFARDALNGGALSYLGRRTGDTAAPLPPGNIPFLDRPQGLSMTGDGLFLYVAAGESDAITVFERIPISGGLIYRSAAVNGVANVTHLDAPQSVLASADGQNVYTASFESNAVVAFSRGAQGALTQIDVALDDDGDAQGLEAPQAVAEDPDGEFLYVAAQGRVFGANAGFGGVSVFTRNLDGELDFQELHQQGDGVVDGLWGPRDLVVSPDGKHVYVASGGFMTGPAAIAVFGRNAVNGSLTYLTSYFDDELGDTQFNAVAASPDGSLVFVAAQGEFPISGTGSLLVFARDASSGALTLIQRFDNQTPGVSGLAGAFGVEVSGDGANVYVSSEQEPPDDAERGAVTIFTVPEPGAAAAATWSLAALFGLARRRASRD